MGLKEYDYSSTELLKTVTVEVHQGSDRVSMYQALDRLNDLVEVGDEYQGGCTGLDALVYHLDSYTVERAIKALEQIKEHFKKV